MYRLVVVGAGGFGREVIQYLLDCINSPKYKPYFTIKGFLDDNPNILTESYLGFGIIGNTYDYNIQNDDRFLIAVGEPSVNSDVTRRLISRGARLFTLIHPLSYVADTAQISKGSILCPFSFVGPGTTLGNNVIINTYASVGHDAQIGSYCILSPYATVNGNVSLDDKVFMGTHSTVVLGKKVGLSTKISAGAVVMSNIPSGYLVRGNPAKGRMFYRF